MILMRKGGHVARLAMSRRDVEAAQRLRAICFGRPARHDVDPFDARCHHVLVEETAGGRLVCCFRLLPLTGAGIGQSYSAQFYDLSALEHFDGSMLELGRFCIHPECRDPDVLRLAWAALTAVVDDRKIALLFGCVSFEGVEAAAYLDVFAMLKARHLAPACWLPRIKAPQVFRFAARLRRKPDLKRALAVMPPLLRTYLTMGGWVSDHAVVDAAMGTLHVFTGVETAMIPPQRKRLLRAMV